ncbi:hypothetical protein [uncultured Acetatifactor sp.]|uniref:hypothetical protein n=1 Tax=uncultured Acetatifactor sp. TaxID=1671927 RepID=UPI002629540F|nr:hypothetical protein [uncultured Acetatifactor sp.]
MLREYDTLYEAYYDCELNKVQIWADKISERGAALLDNSESQFSLNNEQRDRKIIVSVTSIPERLEAVIYPIESMLVQTVRPDGIIIWLDKSRLSDNLLPGKLLALRKYGLEVYYVDDIGPHTKYYYAMRNFPDSFIITIDDDVFYKRTLIEELLDTYKLNLNCVCAHWVWKMKFTSNGIPYPFQEFYLGQGEAELEASHDLLALGVGGVLYPPGCLSERAFEVEAIQELALKADDIWLKAMEILDDVKVARVKGKYLKDPFIRNTQRTALSIENHIGGNDRTIRRVFQQFGLMRFFQKSVDSTYSKYVTIKRWFMLCQRNMQLFNYLQKRRIQTIAIYGMGEIGEMLFQNLKNSPVKVLYGIDQRAEQLHSDVPILRLEQIHDEIDMIIITAKVDYQSIRNSLMQYVQCDVMTLDDILTEVNWYDGDF